MRAPSRTSLRALLLSAALLGSAAAKGASLYWDGASTGADADGGSGTWNTSSANWLDAATAGNPAIWSNANPDSAFFGGLAGTVTLGEAVTTSGLTFATTGYTVTGSTLTFASGATVSMASGINATLASQISGALVKQGAGTLTFNNQKSYTGGTTLNAGTLDLTGGGGANGVIRGTATVNSGAELRLSTGDATGYNTGSASLTSINVVGGTLNINTTSNQTLGGASINLTGGAITGVSGSNLDFFQGASTVNTLASSAESTISGVIVSIRQAAGLTFTVADGAAATDLRVSSVIANNSSFTTAALIKAGAGTMALTSASTLSGPLQVNGGRLVVSNSLRSVSGITVASGATLELGATNMFTGGHGTAWDRLITVNGGTLLMNGSMDSRIGSVTLNNGGTWTSNRALSGWDILVGAVTAGSPTITVSGLAASAALMNGSGGVHLGGSTNFSVADITGSAASDLTVSMQLDNGGSAGGNGAVVKSGAGTMTFTRQMTYTGGTTLNGGVLDITGGGGASGAIRGTVTVNAGATLRLSIGDATGYDANDSSLRTFNLVGGTLDINTASNQTLGGATLNLTGAAITGIANSNLDFFRGSSALNTLASSASSTISGVRLAPLRQGSTTFTVADGAAAIDLDISSVIQASPSGDAAGAVLTKAGDGVMRLSGANTYARATLIRAGTVIAANSSAFGTAGPVTLGDASTGASHVALRLDATAGAIDLSRALTVANQGTGTAILGSSTSSGTSLAVFSGAVTLARDVILDGGSAGDRLGFTGGISGTGNVTVSGANRVVLSGAASSYTGSTTVNAGAILQLGDGSSSSASHLPDAGLVTVSGTLNLAKGGNSESIAQLAGSGTVRAVSGADTLVLGADNSSSSFAGAFAQDAGQTLAVTKVGSGTLTLSGSSSHTGATTVSAGTLTLAAGGSLGSGSALTVAGGATLRGFGSSTGAATLQSGASLVAGNGTSGSLTLGNLTLEGAATLGIGTFTNYSGTAAISAGTLTATGAAGSVVINLGGGGAVNGAYDLIAFAGGSIGGTGLAAFVLGTAPTTSSRQTPSLQVTGSVLQYVVTGATPYWTGLQGASWTTATVGGDGNWKLDTDNSVTDYLAADAVVFNDLATGTTVAIDDADVAPTSILVSGAKAFTFQGSKAMTGGLLAKSGSGTLTLLTANSFAGGTTLTGGRIRVGTDTALGAGILALNGGALSSDSSSTRTLANPVTIGGNVTLGDAVDNGSLVLTGSVALGGAQREIATDSDITLSGVVSEGGITKLGAGALVLSGANTYGLGTSVAGGIVRVAAAGALGTGAVTLVAGGELDLNGQSLANALVLSGGTLSGSGALSGPVNLGGAARTFAQASLALSGAIGNGAVVKSGSGILTLSGSSTYSGGTTLSAGSLRVGSDSALGTGALTLSGGRLSSASTSARTLANAVVVGGAATLGDPTLNGVLSFTGTFGLGGANPLLTLDSDVTLSGIVSNGGLRKSGAGTLTLSGANTYSGGTSVLGGVLSLASLSDDASGPLGAASSWLALANGTLRYTGAGAATSTRELWIDSGAGTIEVANASGILTLNPSGGTRSRNFTKTGAGTLDLGGAFSGSGTLTVDGGTLILRARSTSTGAAVVNAGTLVLSTPGLGKALATSLLTVRSGATVRVTGTNVLYTSNAPVDGIPILLDGGTLRFDYAAAAGHNHLGAITLRGGTLTGTSAGTPYASEYSTLDAGVTVDGSARSVISGANAAHTFALAAGTNTFTVGSTGDAQGIDLLVSAALSGGSALRKLGAGNMVLSAGNTYSGGTSVDAGTLTLARANTSAGTVAGTLTVNSGGTLRIGGMDALGYTSGRGSLVINPGGTVTGNVGLRATLANVITMTGGLLTGDGAGDAYGNYSLLSSSGVTATSDASGNAAVISAQRLSLQASGGLSSFSVSRGSAAPAADLLVTGAISRYGTDTNGIRKTGSGIMTLTGANDYVGSTTVDGGLLRLTSGGRLYSGAYNGSAVVTVNAGATLELENWGYGEADRSLGGLRNSAAALVVDGGTIRVTGSDNYGRGVTVNAGGATLEAAAGANWVLDAADGDIAWVYSGNPDLTLAGAGDGTFGKAFAGTGSLIKSGAGAWTLAAASTFSGGVMVGGGTLRIADVSALGTGTVTVSAGFLDLAGLNPANLISLAGGQLLNAQNWAPAQVQVSGSVSAATLGSLAAPVVTLASGSVADLAGVAKQVVVVGSVTLSNLGAFAGSLAVDAGATVDLSDAADRPAGLGLELRAGGALDFGSGTDFTGTVTYKGGQVSGSAFKGTLNVAGAGVALSDANLSGGTAVVGAGSTVDVTAYSGALRLTSTGAVASGLSDFSGTLELVSGGTVDLTQDDAPLAEITVASGGILRGSGLVGDLIVGAGGKLSPGNSPGLVSPGTLTLEAGGSMDIEVLALSSNLGPPQAGSDYDAFDVAGLVDLTGLAAGAYVINLLSLSGLTTPGDVADFDPQEGFTLDLIRYGSLDLGGESVTSLFTVNTAGFTHQGSSVAASRFSLVDNSGNNVIQLVYAPIPEPSTYGIILGALALAAAAVRRRRRR